MREHADKIVELGMDKLGYQYLCVDGERFCPLFAGTLCLLLHTYAAAALRTLQVCSLACCSWKSPCCGADAWSELQRDDQGHILANKVTFPSGQSCSQISYFLKFISKSKVTTAGMKALGDYAHSKGTSQLAVYTFIDAA